MQNGNNELIWCCGQFVNRVNNGERFFGRQIDRWVILGKAGWLSTETEGGWPGVTVSNTFP